MLNISSDYRSGQKLVYSYKTHIQSRSQKQLETLAYIITTNGLLMSINLRLKCNSFYLNLKTV